MNFLQDLISSPKTPTAIDNNLNPIQEDLNQACDLIVAKKFSEAHALHKKLVMRDCKGALYLLATDYLEGRGVGKNLQLAVRYLVQSLEFDSSNAKAQNQLGKIYCQHKDYLNAYQCFNQAHELGYPQATFNIGRMYEEGWGLAKDIKKAVEWYEKAAASGCAEAMFCMGRLYENGLGCAKDIQAATGWYQQAASSGSSKAMFHIGRLHESGLGCAKDIQAAVEWYKKAASSGLPEAMLNIAERYEHGQEVEKNFRLAFHWYEQAAQAGDTKARLKLGVMYRDGIGVEEDRGKAVHDYLLKIQPGDQHYLRAQLELGKLYLKNYQETDGDLGDFRNRTYEYLSIPYNATEDSTNEINITKKEAKQIRAEAAFYLGVWHSQRMAERIKEIEAKVIRGEIAPVQYPQKRSDLKLGYSTALFFLEEADRLGFPNAGTLIGTTYFNFGKELLFVKVLKDVQKVNPFKVIEGAKTMLTTGQINITPTFRQAKEHHFLNEYSGLGSGFPMHNNSQSLEERAFECFVRAAEYGHEEAQAKVASILEPRIQARDEDEAREAAKLAAKKLVNSSEVVKTEETSPHQTIVSDNSSNVRQNSVDSHPEDSNL